MKIALVIERMDPSRGGRETSTAQIAAGLARRGQEVSILCQEASWEKDSVEVCPLGARGLSRVGRLLNFVADVQRTIKSGDFDIVHSTLPLPGANIYQPRGGTVPGQMQSRLRRFGLLGRLAVRLSEPLKATRLAMYRMEQQLADDPKVLWLAVSELVAKEFQKYYHRQKKVKIIFNGADVPVADADQKRLWREEKRSEWAIGADDFVLLSVANNFSLKGVAETIRAFAQWSQTSTGNSRGRLVVVGNDAPAAYQRLAVELGVGGKVVFVGPSEQIFQCYAAADACILLSWYDPCSRVILEAVRWGLASLTTVYNGASEIINTGAGIAVASPRDTQAVIKGISELADPQRRVEMTKACQAIAGQVTMEHHLDQLLDAYAQAVR